MLRIFFEDGGQTARLVIHYLPPLFPVERPFMTLARSTASLLLRQAFARRFLSLAFSGEKVLRRVLSKSPMHAMRWEGD